MLRGIVLAVLVSVIFTSVYAFDDGPEWMGEISRPGYAELRVNPVPLAIVDKRVGYYSENAITGTPRAMTFQYNSGITPENPNALADNLIRAYADYIKVDKSDFRVVSNNFVLNKFYFINLRQTFNGVDVYGSRLALRVTPEGKVFFAGGDIFPNIEISTQPALSSPVASESAVRGIVFDKAKDDLEYVSLYVLPLIFDDKIEYRLCHMYYVNTQEPLANWQVFVDANNGNVIWREDMTHYETISGSITGMIQWQTPTEMQEQAPLPNFAIYANNVLETTTDSQGYYSFDVSGVDPVNIALSFRGPYLDVNNQAGADSWISEDITPGGEYNVLWSDTNSLIQERDAFLHGQVVHDFIKAIDPDLEVMDFQMICRINVDGSCNAFYSRQDRSINFYEASLNCPNIAQIADVVYHEWGHGLTNISYNAGGSQDPDGAMHEGFSDFIACLITDQSRIGQGFYGPGTFLRNLDNTNRYPDDWEGESHHDGQIIGGALWDLKEMLEPERLNYVDTLWQYAKYGYAYNFEQYFWDLLTVDDDDGDLDNGTPHAYEIYYSFGDLHGIGPGVNIEIDHTPLTDTEDSTSAYYVEAAVYSQFGMSEGAVTLYYSTGGDFTAIELVNASGDIWIGEIPIQPMGTTINYYIVVTDDLNIHDYVPEGAPDETYSFYIGYDLMPPTMSEEVGPSSTIDIFGPYGKFSFHAWDVHEIDETSGELYYKVNDGAEQSVEMVYNSLTGVFSYEALDIGEVLSVGDSIHYYFTCNDMALNQNQGRYPEADYFNFIIASSELIGDFEDGLSNWQVTNGVWFALSNQGYQSRGCVKTSEIFYPNDANSVLYFDTPLNCTLYDGLWLKFWHKNYIRDEDTCYVVAANNPDGPWQRFDGITGTSTFWVSQVSYLDGMFGPGNDEVYVGLQFVSDETNNYFGIYADQFTLYVETPTAVEPVSTLPNEFTLGQNYPNPFNMRTVIDFTLPENTEVNLEVFDILGRKVKQLVNKRLDPGYHQLVWDGRNDSGEIVTSGIYFYRLSYGDKLEVKSMTLLK